MKNALLICLIGIFVLCLTPSLGWAQNELPEKETDETDTNTGVSALEMLFGASDFEIDWDEANKHPLGSAENPVRCDMPRGERAYLERLRCAKKNKVPKYSRAGSMGEGPFGHIMDMYIVECKGQKEKQIYMDMYFPGYVEEKPVPGFSIIPAQEID